MAKLQRIHIAGFRSLRDVDLTDIGGVTILIGPNGAGKSNVLWALEMIRMLAFESLQLFVSERGGATYLMHYGPQKTAAIDVTLEFAMEQGENAYSVRLGYGANESLYFLWERAGRRHAPEAEWRWSDLGGGHQESKLREAAETDKTAKSVRWALRKLNFYHFHDTSRRSRLRTRDFADAGGDYLRSDGSNLATFLEALQASDDSADRVAWARIEETLKRVAPFIRRLVPVRDRNLARLEWVDETGATFGPAHLSDGTLRALALISALGQPDSRMPLVSSIDEPELGLHPSALQIVCALILSVAARRQVIVSTQSPVVLDQFEANQIAVAERHEGATLLRRLDARALERWLEEYSLSELYDKNVLGGRP